MKRLPAFEQWLYEFDVPEEQLEKMREIAFSLPYRINQVNYTTEVLDTLHLEDIRSVRAWVDENLEQVKEDLHLECDKVVSTVEWFNKSEKGMWHQSHVHDNSFLSGIVYLTPSNAETWFSIPNLWGPKGTTFNLIRSDLYYTFLKYPTTVGKMIVFPSKMLHSVTNHLGDEPRYTMSFNAFPSGLIGSKAETHYRRFMHITVNQEQ